MYGELIMFRRLVITNFLHYFQIIASLVFVSFTEFSWWGLLAAYVGLFCFGCLGVEINSHRYFSHKSFEYKYKWMRYVFSWFNCLSGTGSPMQWVATHHAHHKHSDKEGDPHNPREKGLMMFLFLSYPEVNKMSVKHMVKDKYQVWIHNNILLVYLITWAVLYLLGGLWLVVWAGMIPSVLVALVQIMTTYLCHMDFGYTNYKTEDKSKNVWWWALFDFGEALHNNHHANTKRWYLSDKWWEVDISGLVIKYFLKNKKDPALVNEIFDEDFTEFGYEKR